MNLVEVELIKEDNMIWVISLIDFFDKKKYCWIWNIGYVEIKILESFVNKGN